MDEIPQHLHAFVVRPVGESDRLWASDIVSGRGAEFVVTCGRKVYPVEMELDGGRPRSAGAAQEEATA